MNIAVVTEGKSEKYVYKGWIPFINPSLSYVDRTGLIVSNQFSIQHSQGYPDYFDVIDGSIEDVNNHGNIDRFVIVVDSEDMTLQDKLSEMTGHIKTRKCSAQIFVVVQHFCLETWALANKLACLTNPKSHPFREFKGF